MLYIGVTSDLFRRMYEHRNGLNEGFSKRYNLRYLVYFEHGTDIGAAIQREKQLKKWRRAWKEELISKMNPFWKDLSEDFMGDYDDDLVT